MKKIILFVIHIIFMNSIMAQFSTIKSVRLELSNGDSLELKESLFTSIGTDYDQIKMLSNPIADYHANALSKSVLIQSTNPGNKIDMRRNYYTNLKDYFLWGYYPGEIVYDIWPNKTHDQIMNIMSSRIVREALYRQGIKMICDLAKVFPKDFKKDAVKTLHEAIAVLHKMEYHKFEKVVVDVVDDEMTYNELYIDGVRESESSYQYDGFEGFFIRRVINNNIPISEMLAYANKAVEALEAVDVSENPEIASFISINGDIIMAKTINGIVFYNKYKEELQYFGNRKIFYSNDPEDNKKYYIFRHNEWWRPYNSNSIITNSNGKVIEEINSY